MRNGFIRNLNPKLHTDARFKIANTIKRRFTYSKNGILLYFASQIKLLDLRGQGRRTSKAVSTTEFIDEVSLRHHASAEEEKTSEAVLKGRSIPQRDRRQCASADKSVIGLECAVDNLVAGLVKIKRRTDISEECERCGAEDRDPIFNISQQLRVAADKPEILKKEARIRTAGSRELAQTCNVRERCCIESQPRICRGARGVCRHCYIPGRYECVVRSDRAESS